MANQSLLEPAPLVEKRPSRRYADWLTQNEELIDTPEYKDVARAYEMARRQEESRTGMEALQEGIANLPSSTLKLGKEFVTGAADALSYPFREPKEFGKTVIGIGKTAFPSVSGREEESPLTRPAEGLLGHYRGYLDPEVLKRRFADNPAQTLSDISLVGYGAGRAIKAVPTAPTEFVGSKLASVSEAVDPLTIATKPFTYTAEKIGSIPLPNIPTANELKIKAKEAYKKVTGSGISFGQSTFDDFANKVKSGLKDDEGFDVIVDPKNHPSASGVLEEFERRKGSYKTIDEMEALRRYVNGAANTALKGGRADDARIIMMIRDELDELVENAPVVSANPAADKMGREALVEARDLWSRARKGEVIDELLETARLRGQGRTLGFERELRSEFTNLAKNKKRMRGFTKAEQEAIKSVVEGGSLTNVFRAIGIAAPSSIQATLASLGFGGVAGATALGGLSTPVAAIAGAVPIIGGASRRVAQKGTELKAAQASAKIRAGRAPANVREKLADLLSTYGDALAAKDKTLAFAVDFARRSKGKVNPYLTRQLIAQLENIERLSQQRQALEEAGKEE